ncbi:hypothetical protein [Amycolatopsis magusensis]|uniref:hypothetical protein n=1 Tax=Amycolatopsis magusensis TaxID=882444 RepID=UPI003C3040C8
MSNYLHRTLGAGAHARALVCRPGEQLRWAGFARTHYYDIKRLSPVGEPKGGALGRGIANFTGDVVSELLGGSDEGSDKPPPADVLVSGPAPDCLAHRYLRDLPSISRVLLRLWVLTPDRLVVLTERPPVVEEAPEPAQSLLGKASRFGKGLAKFGKDVAAIVADNRTKFGDNREGEPVAPKEFLPAVEIPAAQIADASTTARGVRVSLVDGSGFEFVRGVAASNWELPTAESELKIVTKEMSGHWLRSGERLVLACAPINGYTGVQLGDDLRLPHEPLGEVPEVELGKLKWPRPADWTLRTQGADWADDPTVAFWAHATRPDQDAVRFADHLAHTRGDARLTLTTTRAAVVYPSSLLTDPGDGPFTTFCEVDASRVRRLSADRGDRSVPASPVIRLDFTDDSVLLVRDPLTSRRLGR